jgi:hypothetical protein
MRLSLRILAILLSIYSVGFLFCGAVQTVYAQSDLQTTKYRNMVIDLGDGLGSWQLPHLNVQCEEIDNQVKTSLNVTYSV